MTNATALARAIAPEPCKFDLSAVEQRGRLEYLFPPDRDRPAVWSREWPAVLGKAIADAKWDPEHDLFVAVGSTAMVVMIGAALARRFGTYRALLWCQSANDFVERRLGS